MEDWWVLLVVAAVWYVAARFVFPKLGIRT